MKGSQRLQLLCAVLFIAGRFLHTSGQGLKLPPDLKPGSSSVFPKFLEQYGAAQRWKAAYKQHPSAACAQNGTLCSPVLYEKVPGMTAAQLAIATSPDIYDARLSTNAISRPKDQGDCHTSIAFATIAGAEAAVASVAGVQGSSISLSELDLYYCSRGDIEDDDGDGHSSSSSAAQRRPQLTCRSGGWLGLPLKELQRRKLQTRYCMPYGTFATATDACSVRACNSMDATSSQGSFAWFGLGQIWKVQQQIRLYGGVVTRFDIYDDFNSFFKNPSNARKVYSPKKGAKVLGSHAVFVIGYNNVEKFWIVKNSHGTSWADQGFFKVAMGVCNVMDPSSTFGITWESSIIKRKRLSVVPVPGRPECFFYRAQVSDYVSKLAWLFGVRLGDFLQENTDTVKNLNLPLTGKQLVVCRPQQGTYKAPEAKVADALQDSQLAALMNMKRSLDREELLQEWSWQSGNRGGYCRWPGITCDSAKTVVVAVDVSFGRIQRGLKGTLPAGALLQGLPGLKLLNISGHNRPGVSAGITGPLQADWTRLAQLQQVLLDGNSLTGLLPPSWSELQQLQTIDLQKNRLRGPLPESWSKFKALEVLWLQGNMLEGTVPGAWTKGMPRLLDISLAKNRKLNGCNQRLLVAAAAASEEERKKFWCKVNCKKKC